jgi:hypothetical protein
MSDLIDCDIHARTFSRNSSFTVERLHPSYEDLNELLRKLKLNFYFARPTKLLMKIKRGFENQEAAINFKKQHSQRLH